MGEAYRLTCDTCAFNANIFVGIGFSYMTLESIASFVKDHTLKERIEAFAKDPTTRFDACNALYVCPSCKVIRNELFMKMSSESSHYSTSYACNNCHSPLKQMPLELGSPIHLGCPECSHGKLEAAFYMDWD